MTKELILQKYSAGDWYQDEYIGGFVMADGSIDVCVEYGSDADFGLHFEDVLNGLGYYDYTGKFIRYELGDY